MLEKLWVSLIGGLDVAQLGIIAGAIGFCWNQLSMAFDRKQKAKTEKQQTLMEEAVIAVASTQEARDAGAKLSTTNEVPYEKGDSLLEKAVDTAITLAQSRNINLGKELGGREGVKTATQTTFTRLKDMLHRDK